MALLMLFALVAGAGTALSPCVLPVLPALLSAGATGGRRRPVGIALGLAATFTITIVGLASVIDGVGPRAGGDAHAGGRRPHRLRRRGRRAVAGRAPRGAARAPGAPGPARTGRRLRVGPARRRRPRLRLRAVRRADPGRGHRRRRGLVAHRPRRPGLRAGLGARPARARARRPRAGRAPARGRARPRPAARAWRPSSSSPASRWRRASTCASSRRSPTTCPPRSSTRRTASRPRTPSPAASTTCAGPSRFAVAGTGRQGVESARLPRLGAAPDFVGNQRWFNTPGGRPLSLESLRGKVVLVDFWTYTCINCLRTLPYLEAWDRRYRSDGLVIVGVHSPEFPFERDAGNVRGGDRARGDPLSGGAGQQAGHLGRLGQPVLARRVPDRRPRPGPRRALRRGRVRPHRDEHPGAPEGGRPSQPGRRWPSRRAPCTRRAWRRPRPTSASRAPSASTRRRCQGTHTYAQPSKLATSHFALAGTWDVSPDAATARAGAEIHAAIVGKDVYLVLSPPARGGGDVRVLLDGRPIAADRAGADVPRGRRARRSPAPVPPGLGARERAPRADPARLARRPGVRVHLRIAALTAHSNPSSRPRATAWSRPRAPSLA